MWKKSRQVAAFTLIECLLALLVLSGGVLIFDGLTRLVGQEVGYQSNHEERNWLVFAHQLRAELEGTEFVKVENNRLYIKKGTQQLAFGKSRADDFRKTNDKGQGYQPMLYHLESAKIRQIDQMIEIDLVFQNGLERTFVYAFETAG